MNRNELHDIASAFRIKGDKILSAEPLGNGLINDTYKIETDQEAYVLQRINHSIFKNVDLMQNNIRTVTEHIRNKLKKQGVADLERKTLTPVPASDGKEYYTAGGEYWRMTLYIKGSRTYEQVSPELARRAGEAFGAFHGMLADLPENALGYTIPHFHDMEFRLEEFRQAIAADKAGRLNRSLLIEGRETILRELTATLLERADDMCRAERMGRAGKLPRRITHCDTKVNNMLFDEEDRFLCVIDLDTVMPGFVLSDYGDFIRTAGNTAAEDEPDVAKIGLDKTVFESFTEGYLKGSQSFLTEEEARMLPYGARLLTYMQTVRFLTDYLNGDIYYKIRYPEHNLVRTLAQFAFLRELERNEKYMADFIETADRIR